MMKAEIKGNEATPRPWRVLARNRKLRHGRGMGYDVQQDTSDGLGEMICDRATEADAALIVRAVNAYDALVTSCRELLEFVPVEKPERGGLPDWIIAIELKAHAALALARGEKP